MGACDQPAQCGRCQEPGVAGPQVSGRRAAPESGKGRGVGGSQTRPCVLGDMGTGEGLRAVQISEVSL